METKPPLDKKLLLMPNSPVAEQQTAVTEAAPETTAISFTGPLTRDSLSEYSEAQLIRNAKKVIPRAFRALAKLVDEGDRKALELALTTYSYLGKGGGVTIVNQVLTQNNNISGGPTGKTPPYFEGILQRIEKAEQKSKIIDAEVMDASE